MFLQLMQIDDVLFIPLPFETTKESGARIAQQCADHLAAEKKNDLRFFVPISCANGYFGYVTTPEEYSIQRYEGGHTLYGPQTQPFLTRHLSKMTLEMGKEKPEPVFTGQRSYHLRAKNFITGKTVTKVERKAIFNPEFVAAKINDEPYWSFVWEDLPPYLISWGQPLVRIEESADKNLWQQSVMDGQILNDGGYDIAVLLNDESDERKTGIYETRWYNPPLEEKNKYYRFVILPQAGQNFLYSAPFH